VVGPLFSEANERSSAINWRKKEKAVKDKKERKPLCDIFLRLAVMIVSAAAADAANLCAAKFSGGRRRRRRRRRSRWICLVGAVTGTVYYIVPTDIRQCLLFVVEEEEATPFFCRFSGQPARPARLPAPASCSTSTFAAYPEQSHRLWQSGGAEQPT
jgi:hypothetical protein